MGGLPALAGGLELAGESGWGGYESKLAPPTDCCRIPELAELSTRPYP